jgi:exonuclease III
MGSDNILIWNVWGLNADSHRDALHNLVAAKRTSFVCIQETKLVEINDFDVSQLLGTSFDYAFLPATHTRGGILVAWKAVAWSALSISTRRFSVSVKMRHLSSGVEWWLTSVYGPFQDADKSAFISELQELRLLRLGP